MKARPTPLMWIFLLLCLMMGAGQPWLRLISMWLLGIVVITWHRRLCLPKSTMWLLIISGVWWMSLLLPLPLQFHQVIMPTISGLRTPIAQLVDIAWLPLAIDPSIHLVDGLTIAMLGFICWSQRRQDSQDWIHFLCYSGLLLAWIGFAHRIFQIEHLFGFISVPPELRSPFFAPFINGNHAGYLFCALIPLGFRLQHTSIQKTIVLLHFGTAICLTGSRGAMGVAGFMLLLALGVPLQYMLMSILIGIVGLFQMDLALDEFTHGRLALWQDTFRAIELTFPIGAGFGGFSELFPIVKSTPEYIQSTHAHQEYLEWILSGGLLGVVALIVFGVHFWKHRSQTPDAIAFQRVLLAFGLAGLVDFPLQLNALLLLAIVAWKFSLTSSSPSTQIQISVPTFIPLILLMICTAGWFSNSPYGYPNNQDDNRTHVRKSILNETALTKLLHDNIDALPDTPNTESLVALDTLIQRHAAHHPRNIQTQRLLASWFHTREQYDKACETWSTIWELETPILTDKLDWVPEALSCDPNLWNALIALPDDVTILVRAHQELQRQGFAEPAVFCLQRAHDLQNQSPLGSLQYVQWLVEQQDWGKAWRIHQGITLSEETPQSQLCLYHKLDAELGSHYSLDINPQQYRTLMERCGIRKHWQRRQILAELKLGEVEAITTATMWITEDPKDLKNLWQYLAHAEQQRENQEAACQWIQRAFHLNPQKVNDDYIKQCAQGEFPFSMPLWKIHTETDINNSL